MINRKLAAILFGDIVGYTALMQKGEVKAMTLLNRFQEVTTDKVAEYKGEIVKTYGDGSLILFDSTVNAVLCAKAMQIEFAKEPVVPLRIGIHEGDVIQKDNDVFGNGVNIAARVESMGVAGAILMSSDVQKRIKNQESIITQSLGTFEFKNVKEPIELFALANGGFAIPKSDEMQGKGKATSKNSKKLWYVLIPLLLLISAFSIYQWQQPTQTPKITADIRNERIAVLPFKNNTNDADLEILGDMSADWINRGLMEMEDVEVTSPFTVRSNLGALGVAPNDPQGRKSFSELTGAQNMLSGNYYEESGDIIFQLQIESATDGKIRFIFDPIRGPKDDKEALLTRLGSRVAGYWMAREMVDSKNIQAPNYEAYVAYQNALRKVGAGTEYAKVFELDSSFYLARLHFINSNRYGLFGNNLEHFEFLERHASELSNYETVWYNYLKGLFLGYRLQAFESINKLRKQYPKDFFINHETAGLASNTFNNPELTLEIYNELPIEEVDAASVGIHYNFRIIHEVFSYIKIGQYSNLSTYLNKVNVAPKTMKSVYIAALLTKALAENDPDDIDKAYAQFLKVYEYDKLSFFYWSSSFDNSPIRDRLRRDQKSLYQKLPPTDFSATLNKPWIAYIDGKSQKMSLNEIRKLPKTSAIISLFAEAMVCLDNNNQDKSYDYINELMEYTSIGFDQTSAAGPGYANYYLGKIFTKMGQPDEAIKYLKESRNFGFPVWLFYYKYDPELASLVGIPEFDALHDPIWPEVKD